MTDITSNIFAEIPEKVPQELFLTLAESAGTRIERIVSDGQATPAGQWYDQGWDEWVLLLSGSAGLLFEGEKDERRLSAGDYLMIPAGCRHRVQWTDQTTRTVWLAIHINNSATKES